MTLPDAGDRYLSAMVVNEQHYINEVLHGAGDHELRQEDHGSRFVAVAARVFLDPEDPPTWLRSTPSRDRFAITAGSDGPYEHPEYDAAGLDATRDALLALGRPRRRHLHVRPGGRRRPCPPPHRHWWSAGAASPSARPSTRSTARPARCQAYTLTFATCRWTPSGR